MGKELRFLDSETSVSSDPWVDYPCPPGCWSWQVGTAISVVSSLASWLGQGWPLPPSWPGFACFRGFLAFEALHHLLYGLRSWTFISAYKIHYPGGPSAGPVTLNSLSNDVRTFQEWKLEPLCWTTPLRQPLQTRSSLPYCFPPLTSCF